MTWFDDYAAAQGVAISTRTATSVNVAPSTFPAWRRAMTNTDTVYVVSTNLPSGANSQFVWPGGVPPPSEVGSAGSNYGAHQLYDYGSMTNVRDDGAWGTFVFNNGGHAVNPTYNLGLNISADAPAYFAWQQPQYQTSDANGADLFYNPAWVAANVPAERQFNDPSGPSQPVWDGTFPYSCVGWAFVRKAVHGTYGNGSDGWQPCYGGRYAYPYWLPPEMTGVGSGAYCTYHPVGGPFGARMVFSDNTFAGDAKAWVPEALHPSGRRKDHEYYKSTATRKWAKGSAMPDYYFDVLDRQFVDYENKKLYMMKGAGEGFFERDYSNGIAGVTTVYKPTLAGIGYDPYFHYYGGWCFTHNHPTGRRLAIGRNGNPYASGILENHLCVYDMDTWTIARVYLTGPTLPPFSEYVTMQYNPTTNSVILLQYGQVITQYWSLGLPADPMYAAGWTNEVRPLTNATGGAMVVNQVYGYSRDGYHPELGVVFIPQSSGKMLAFRPA